MGLQKKYLCDLCDLTRDISNSCQENNTLGRGRSPKVSSGLFSVRLRVGDGWYKV